MESSCIVEESAKIQSALEENINRKGNNSYYYAHGFKANGPAWDGKEQPRLISKTSGDCIDNVRQPIAIDSISKKVGDVQIVEFDNYAWTDDKKTVKIYVDFDKAQECLDEKISVSNTDNAFDFCVETGTEIKTKRYVLKIKDLLHPIVNVTYKKKSDKFVLSLKKQEEDRTWIDLKKKSNSSE